MLEVNIAAYISDHEIKEDWDFTIPQDALLLESAVQLGQGGFGKVFRTHLKGNPVAVKVIKTIQDKDSKRIPLTEGKLLRYVYVEVPKKQLLNLVKIVNVITS